MKPFESLPVRPYQLMCVICRVGEGRPPVPFEDRVTQILTAVRRSPNAPVTLRCNVDSVYRYQNPGREEDTPEGDLFNDKRDLDILQKIGLTPGATRPAREIIRRVFDAIPTPKGICEYEEATSETWRGCPRASGGFYEQGHGMGIGAVIPRRPEEDKARAKGKSAQVIYDSKTLRIRPHHLMCMACFHAGKEELAPIAEDNLFEAIDAIQKNPKVPVTLIAGCCMICPPCSSYDPATNLCISESGMALRDQKKDLDVLQLLGLRYGDTLPARELYARLLRAVRSTTQICGYGDGVARGWEWRVCSGPKGSERYRRARAAGMGFLPPFSD